MDRSRAATAAVEPNSSSQLSQMENIKVAVRLRPFTEKEKLRNQKCIVEIEQNTVILHCSRYSNDPSSSKKFTFDHSYWSHDGFKRDSTGVNIPDESHPNCDKYVSQEKVFEDLGRFLLNNTIEGYNSALIAYGQTGSGKSYTVSGYGQNDGILPRFARSLFEELDRKFSDEGRYEIHFSMYEIYNEVVRDLLIKSTADPVSQSRRGLKVREHPKHGFFVENLSSFICSGRQEIEQKIKEGQLNKSIAATSMNETSSRGHTIYEFRIKQFKQEKTQDLEEILTSSVVQLVDLAGSERMSVHGTTRNRESSGTVGSPLPVRLSGSSLRAQMYQPATASSSSPAHISHGEQQSSSNSSSSTRRHMLPDLDSASRNNQRRFKESISINQSLSALGNCIQVLSQYSQQIDGNTAHTTSIRRPGPKIPYRDSALTKLLNRCCLSGNSRVVIIATLSPVDSSYDDTLSTLRFADRAKQIKTHAVVNLMNRHELVDSLHKENERLKQIIDGRVTRSDDSSQTSNFDETENLVENLRGRRIARALPVSIAEAVASPARNRTSTRKARRASRQAHRNSPAGVGETGRLSRTTAKTSHSSNPSLAVKNQMRTIVSPASRKIQELNQDKQAMGKSKSLAYDLNSASKQGRHSEEDDPSYEEGLDELYLNDYADDDDDDGLITPDSEEDSFSALADEELTTDEKIDMFNRLLSNSTIYTKPRKHGLESRTSTNTSSNRIARPHKADASRAGIKQVYILSSSLKRSNPYLSNLNQDEQLTGMISYIIKMGETIIGKDSECDIVLHGPELKGRHAKLTRLEVVDTDVTSNVESKFQDTGKPSLVYIEPVMDKTSKSNDSIALKVNGSPVSGRVQLNHCDRVLFGANSYFVFTDDATARKSGRSTVADMDLVTFDMARNEVLRKVMSESSNEAMIREINDYTHRPGTGKQRTKMEHKSDQVGARGNESRASSRSNKGSTVDEPTGVVQTEVIDTLETNRTTEEGSVSPDAQYKDQLMQDTYEFALPVAEMNAVAKEMEIKVSYELKILTGEEQLLGSTCLDSNLSDRLSSSSQGETNIDRVQSAELLTLSRESDNTVTKLDGIDQLDIPPALYVKVNLTEYNFDFYWPKDKFMDRRYKILELYGAWDVGGKSGLVEHLIEQSKVHGEYLVDPFIDDPNMTLTLIGHAQITLKPLLYLTDIKQRFDILDLDDDILGTVDVHALPCHLVSEEQSTSPSSFIPFSEEELNIRMLERPQEQLGKKLAFVMKILSCQNLPSSYSNIFCQYTFGSTISSTRTKMLRESSIESDPQDLDVETRKELVFNHSHYLYFDKVDQSILDFLEHGFLTIQVVGLYKIPENMIGRSPTVVSTIINSINKYRYKLDQQGSTFSAINYPTSAFYMSSNTDSAKSQRNQLPSALATSNSYSGSVVSGSAGTVNLFDGQTEEDEAANSLNGLSQENIIDMILTKRKLDRAENQLVSCR